MGVVLMAFALTLSKVAGANPSARLVYARGPGAESCPDEETLPLAVLFAFAGCGGKVIDVGSNVGPTGDRATAEAGGSDSPGVDSLGPSAGGSAPPTTTDPSQGKCPVPSSSNPGADPSTSCSISGGWSIIDPL